MIRLSITDAATWVGDGVALAALIAAVVAAVLLWHQVRIQREQADEERAAREDQARLVAAQLDDLRSERLAREAQARLVDAQLDDIRFRQNMEQRTQVALVRMHIMKRSIANGTPGESMVVRVENTSGQMVQSVRCSAVWRDSRLETAQNWGVVEDKGVVRYIWHFRERVGSPAVDIPRADQMDCVFTWGAVAVFMHFRDTDGVWWVVSHGGHIERVTSTPPWEDEEWVTRQLTRFG